MPVRTRSIHPDYVTAHKVRALTGIGTYALLRLVASGLVDVQVVPGLYPLYCIADVRKHLDTRLGQHKPTAKTRKMVKT
jgi:hypothetical protein